MSVDYFFAEETYNVGSFGQEEGSGFDPAREIVPSDDNRMIAGFSTVLADFHNVDIQSVPHRFCYLRSDVPGIALMCPLLTNFAGLDELLNI